MWTTKNLLSIVEDFPGDFVVVGSILRKSKNPGDIDLITTKSLDSALKYFEKNYNITDIFQSGENQLFLTLNIKRKPIDINIWKTSKKDYPYFYFWLAYPKTFVQRVRGHFKKKGYLLNQYGLFKNGKKIRIKLEDKHNFVEEQIANGLFKKLRDLGYNYPYRTPEEQESKK